MKFGKLLLVGVSLFAGLQSFAQEGDAERECKRMRFLAGEALNVENYREAAIYYIKGEQKCGGYDNDNYDRLISTLRFTLNQETDANLKAAYNDTLLWAWDQEEAKGFYDESDDLARALSLAQQKEPNRAKADQLFVRGIKATGAKTHESYLLNAYYNAIVLHSTLQGDEQEAMKKRLINDYFDYSKLVTEAKMSVRAQESLTSYLNMIVKSCDDINPMIPGFVSNLPEDKEAAKSSLGNMITLMEEKKCDGGSEYLSLIDALIEIDPNSLDALEAKAKALVSQGKYSDAIGVFKQIQGLTDDEAKKEEAKYSIATIQASKLKSYRAAYNTAMGVKGEYRTKALKIAAQCVAATANSCGDSTFERKCNYIYADQLLSQAGLGKKYTGNYPTSSEKFDAGNPGSVSLSCWGVSVTP